MARYAVAGSDVVSAAERIGRAAQSSFERRSSDYWGEYCLIRHTTSGAEVRVVLNADPIYRAHLDPPEDQFFEPRLGAEQVLIDVDCAPEHAAPWEDIVRRAFPDAIALGEAAADSRSTSPPESVARARTFALVAHGEQRYGDQPYTFHLDAVAAILARYGEEAQTVGYLHDVVEDTAVTLERVREAFGDHVAEFVALVTDEPGGSRRERKARTNAKLSKVEGRTRLALVVKAADRLANLRMSAGDGSDSKLEMYRREHAAFRKAAFRRGLCDDLWAEMEQILSRPPGEA